MRGCIALEFGLVSLGLRCFLRMSCAGLAVVLGSGCCWACSASPCNTVVLTSTFTFVSGSYCCHRGKQGMYWSVVVA